MLRDDETKQHAPRDPENTFFGIEFDDIRSKFRKGLPKIGNEMVSPLGFNHDVINIGLNGPPNEVPEAFEHTAMYVAQRSSDRTALRHSSMI